MASSLSRPDPSSPASVAEAGFSTSRRGYQPDEVRAFLVAVAAEMGRLQERERQLEAELREAREIEQPTELDEEAVASLLGEETLRVLHTARESASQIKIRAEETAARILREANDEANRLRQEVDVEAARRRQDAASDAEAEVALAKQQGREMVNEARAYRERVLADLERRTTLARQQIEELVHGRDRLLQVFERARLVAVDVTSELKAIDSPDELVNLTPTTGPVPIMLPTERRPPLGDDADRPVADAAVGGEDSDGSDADAADDPADGAAADDDESDAAAPHDADHVADDAAGPEAGERDDAPADRSDDDTAASADDDEVDLDGQGEPDGEHDPVGAGDVLDEAGPSGEPEPHDDPKVDTNVVSLFRGRTAPSDDDAADEDPSIDDDRPDEGDDSTDDGIADDGAERPDVGGIFERLRQSVPDGETTTMASAASHDDDDEGAAVATPDESDDAADPVEANAFTRRDEALVPLIVAGARRVKRVLADEQNEALDTLRQGAAVTELDDLVPTADEHVTAYLSALDDELQAAAACGAGELGSNDTKTLRKKLVKAGALAAAESHVRSALVGPLRDRLGRAISDGDGDNDDITKRVRAVYREWKTQHIDDQLDDVFRSAYSGGLHAAAAPDATMVWTSDPRVTACPDCEDNALAGPVSPGDNYPTGHPAAPAHPGCTCLALPVT